MYGIPAPIVDQVIASLVIAIGLIFVGWLLK